MSYTMYMQCSTNPESHAVNDGECTRTLLVHACHVISFLLEVKNVYLGKCTEALQLMYKMINAYILITGG